MITYPPDSRIAIGLENGWPLRTTSLYEWALPDYLGCIIVKSVAFFEHLLLDVENRKVIGCSLNFQI